MKRLLVVALVALGMTRATPAQDQGPSAAQENRNVAADFAQTSAASTPVIPFGTGFSSYATPATGSFLGGSQFSSAIPATTSSPMFAATSSLVPLGGGSVTTLGDPSPAPAPHPPVYLDDSYRMDISLGVSLVRFRSSVFLATGVGTNTSFAYFLTDHLAGEAAINTAFAPTIFQNEHVKYLGYGVGPKYLFWRRGGRQLEPWVHGIIGGAHVFPQTALGSKNGFELMVGGGADWTLNPRLALRLEVDWIRTQLWGQSQNSGQGSLAVVYHF
jgi:hypothetical protein